MEYIAEIIPFNTVVANFRISWWDVKLVWSKRISPLRSLLWGYLKIISRYIYGYEWTLLSKFIIFRPDGWKENHPLKHSKRYVFLRLLANCLDSMPRFSIRIF